MKKITNGLVAKLMDNFISDLYEEIENEYVAEDVYYSWLALGVPDGSDFVDCINDFGEQVDFDDLNETFTNLLKKAKTPYYKFRQYCQEKFKDFQESFEKSLENN